MLEAMDDKKTIQTLQKKLKEKETELSELYKLLERLNSYVDNLIQDTEKGISNVMNLHRKLATKKIPKIGNLSFASRYVMSRSDLNSYFDFFALPNSEGVGLVLCEAKGYGASSVLMTMVMSLIETAYASSPKSFIKVLLEDMQNHLPKGEKPSIFYAVMEKTGLQMKYCSLGMPGVFLVRAKDRKLLDTESKDLDIAEERICKLKPGDKIVLVNNGVMNSQNSKGEKFEAQGVERGLNNADHLPIADIISNLGFELDVFTGSERTNLNGDLAILGVELERKMLYVV
jgi:serine phosphatase RsbU (regulator of sigma subunit)